MPRSRSPRRPDKYIGSRRENVRRRSRSPRRSPKRKSRSLSPRQRSRSHSPRRHSTQKRRSPSPSRRKPYPDRRPPENRMIGHRRSSPPTTHRRGDVRHPPDRRRKPSQGDRTRDRTPSPPPRGLAHMDQEDSRHRAMPSRDGRGDFAMARGSPGRFRRSHSFSPPRKSLPLSRSPQPPQTASFVRPSRSPDRPGPSVRQGINTITMVNPAVRRPLLTERFREEDQIGPLRIDDNITIGIHRSGSHFKSSRKNMPVKRDFDPHCFIMVRRRDEGQKPIFDRKEIHEYERMMAEESERRMISIVPSDDYHRTVSSAGRSDRRGDTRHVKQSAEPKVRLDPKPDPRYEKLYKESRQKEELEHKRLEKVQHNPNDLRHNLLKRRHDDDDDDDNDDGFDARKKIEAKRKDSSKLRPGYRERRSGSRSRSGDRGHRSSDRKRSIDDRLGKGRSGESEDLPDFKNRPDKYRFEDWKQKPEMIPKNPNYYEHDNREDDRSYRGRGRGRFQRSRGFYRGNYRGRGFSSSYRPRGRGFTSSYKGIDRNSSNYERIGRNEPYSKNRNSTGDTWKHDLYDKLEKDEGGSDMKKERHDDRTREGKMNKSSELKEPTADREKVDDNKPSSTT